LFWFIFNKDNPIKYKECIACVNNEWVWYTIQAVNSKTYSINKKVKTIY
jgi:hypothetical protein